MLRPKQKKSYALLCMKAILAVAVLLTGSGFVLRHTLLDGLPQYEGVPSLSVPMMLLQDSSPLRQARERAEWEALHAAGSPAAEPQEIPEPPSPTPVPPEPSPSPTLAPTPEPTPEPIPSLTPEPTPEPTPEMAEESFFDHTLFIGDSKVDEMRKAVRIGEAKYFCDTNYSVYNVFDKLASDRDFTDASLDWVLSRWDFDQIYVALGYNECGYPYQGLMDQFDYVLRRVHESQPQARIILHAVMHANRYVSSAYDYYSVENLEKVNGGLRELADAYDWIWFVDCNAPFCDEDGYLYDYMSMDGEHLLPEYSILWAEEIRRQAVPG